MDFISTKNFEYNYAVFEKRKNKLQVLGLPYRAIKKCGLILQEFVDKTISLSCSHVSESRGRRDAQLTPLSRCTFPDENDLKQ